MNAHVRNLLLPPQLFWLCLLSMLFMRWYYPGFLWLSPPYNRLGIVIIAAGLGITLWGSTTFRLKKTNIYTFNEPDRLVTDGLYKYSRNPIYLGFLFSLTGQFVYLGAASPVIFVVLFFVVTNHWYIAFEEKMLLHKFGKDYEAYQASTRRWV